MHQLQIWPPIALSLFLGCGIGRAQENPDLQRRVVDLRDRAVVLRTIDADDDNFDDLRPLIDHIGDARIVVLGESTHSEGATSQAKCRVIKFLHQEMGFDVLAWEAGLLNSAVMNDQLRADVSLRDATRHMMSGGWSNDVDVNAIFEYARASWKTTRPLEMAGFDGNRPPHGVRDFVNLLRNAMIRAPTLDLTEADLEDMAAVLKVPFGFISTRHTASADTQDAVQLRLAQLRQRFRSPDRSLKTRFSARELTFLARVMQEAIYHLDYTNRRSAARDPFDPVRALDANNLRDRAMADAMLWLANDYYPDRKIVVWCATAHMIHSAATEIEPLEENWDADAYVGWQHMGDHLRRAVGDQIYVIGITAYDGEVGTVFPEGAAYETSVSPLDPGPPPVGSFEDLCHRAELQYAFVDLRGTEPDHWLREPMIAWPLAFARNRARWDRVLDGFLFIHTMSPSRQLPRN